MKGWVILLIKVYVRVQIFGLLHADDTLLICNDTRIMNILIKEIEIESAKYNMKLNQSKCNFTAVNYSGTPNVDFENGTKLKQVEQTINLGAIIDQKGNAALEVNNRIKKAMTTVSY